MKKSKSGFTLVELLVVIVVIAILAGIVIASYAGTQARSRDARRKTDVANIMKAMELYYSDNNTYPISATATGSAINGTWFVSSDASWKILSTFLVGAEAIDAMPTDPTNTVGSVLSSTARYNYAIYVNQATYCGAAAGQMYIIVWKYEAAAKETTSEGACSTNPIGDTYASSYGISYYRNSKV